MSSERILVIMATDLRMDKNGKQPTGKHTKIENLLQSIEREAEKPDEEADLELLEEKAEEFDRLTKDIDHLCPEQSVDEFLKELESLGVDCSKLTPKEEGIGKKRKKGKKGKKDKKKSKKRAVAAVATVAIITTLMFAVVSVAAHNQGYANAWEFITENIKQILNLNAGETMESDGITFVKGEDAVSYASMEELIEAEQIDILYPANLPNDIHVTKITYQNVDENHQIYSFQFNDSNLSLSISNVKSVTQVDLLQYETYEANKITFYIEKITNGTYQAIGQDNEYEYRIIYNDYNVLIEILKNLKGVE